MQKEDCRLGVKCRKRAGGKGEKRQPEIRLDSQKFVEIY